MRNRIIKLIIAIAVIAAVFLLNGCLATNIETGRPCCWYEPETHSSSCGTVVKYSEKTSCYTVRTFEGWTMQVRADKIQWR